MRVDYETLQDLLRALGERGEREAVCAATRDDLVRVDAVGLQRDALRIAGGLHERGLGAEEPVAIFAANTPAWIAACLGILGAGGVVTPLDTQMPAAELRHALQDSGVRWVFTDANGARRLRDLELSEQATLVRLDAGEAGEAPEWKGWPQAALDDLPRVTPEHAATLFYTSGTTGPPKGVPLTHHNLLSNVGALLERELAHPEDRIFVPLPYHHVYPFSIGLLTPVALGATVVLPYSVLGPEIVRALREGEATVILGVPRLYEALDAAIRNRLAERGAVARKLFTGMLALSQWSRRRLGPRAGRAVAQRCFAGLHRRMAPRLRMIVSGGAPLDPALAERLRALGWEVASGYGLTETSPILTYNPPETERLDTAGRVLPGVDLRITPQGDDSGVGEVQAKGPNVFRGYRNLPEKTSKAFTEDGYYRTGDLGWMDEEGFLYLTGRASEMIVLSGGENIDPERVERALCEAPVIRDAGVLEHRNTLVAVVQPDPSATRDLDPEGLQRALRDAVAERSRQLPSHHRIDRFRVTRDPLPRTRLGKMRRHLLREFFEQLETGEGKQADVGPIPEESMAQEDQQLLQIPAVRRVWELLSRRYTRIRLTPDSSVRLDLGVDSLGWLDLTLELRDRAHLAVDDDAIGRIETVRDLLREAAQAQEISGGGEDLVEQLRHPEQLLSEDQRTWLQPRTPWEERLGSFLLWLDRTVMRRYFRLSVHEGQRLPDKDEPVLYAPNHQSLVDAPALGVALAERGGEERLRRIYWGGWTGMLFTSGLVRRISRASQVLPVDPDSGPRSSLALGAAALARGHGLVWFPEGERSPERGLQPFMPGVGLLLRAHPVRVVPVWIEGGGEAMPPGRRWPRRRTLCVRFGEPVDTAELERSGQGENSQERIADALQARVAALGDEEARFHPEGHSSP